MQGKLLKLVLGVGLLCSTCVIFAQKIEAETYIEMYKDIAINEMQRTGIPASIKLAQACIETGYGNSTLATKANNHFGIKCHGDAWRGATFFREDDDYGPNGKLMKSCFRKYRNPESSYIDHSEFLRVNSNYQDLFLLDLHDYRGWAHGLKKARYATAPDYPQKLISVIERFNLHQYDQSGIVLPPIASNNSPDYVTEFMINSAKVYVAYNNMTVSQVALKTNKKAKRIIKYNEALQSSADIISDGHRVFLQPKRNYSQGRAKYHYVEKGESLFQISQLYGIKLKKLKKHNGLKADDVDVLPKPGEKVYIRGSRKRNNPLKILSTTPLPVLSREVTPTKKDPAPLPDRPVTPLPSNKPEPIIYRESDDGYLDMEVAPQISQEDYNKNKSEYLPPVTKSTPIPVEELEEVIEVAPTHETTDEATGDINYTIQKGDTLYKIARQFDVPIEQIKSLNQLTTNVIYIGQTLRIQ